MIVPDRVEVYVDDATVPAQALTAPPFHLTFDTTTVPDGEHTLRIVTRFSDGRRLERRVHIVVHNHPASLPEVALEGLADGDRVAGVIHASLSVKPPAPGRRAGLPIVFYSLAVAAVLVGVWAVFALTGTSLQAPGTLGPSAGAAPASTPGSATSAPSGGGGAVTAGMQQFQIQGCDGCHTIAGTGGTVGPDLTHIGGRMGRSQMVATIVHGRGAMPAFPSIRPADLNALLDFLQSLK